MAEAEAAELFYRGTIMRYAVAHGGGLIRSATGRELEFDLRFVRLHEDYRGRDPKITLAEGLEVGFDVVSDLIQLGCMPKGHQDTIDALTAIADADWPELRREATRALSHIHCG